MCMCVYIYIYIYILLRSLNDIGLQIFIILNGEESEQTLGDSEEQGEQAGCSPWDHKAQDISN